MGEFLRGRVIKHLERDFYGLCFERRGELWARRGCAYIYRNAVIFRRWE